MSVIELYCKMDTKLNFIIWIRQISKLICLLQTAERKVDCNGAEYSETEQSDSDSSSDDDNIDGPCRIHDTSDEEEEEQPTRRKRDYQNVSQLEWDHSTM